MYYKDSFLQWFGKIIMSLEWLKPIFVSVSEGLFYLLLKFSVFESKSIFFSDLFKIVKYVYIDVDT